MSGPEPSHARSNNGSGIVLMLVACAMFVVGDSCLKLVGRDLPLGQMILMRGLMAFPIVLWLAHRAGVLPRLGEMAVMPRLQLRTLFEVGSTMMFLAGLVRMTYADAMAIQQFLPLAVIAGAALFLGEKVGWRRWMAALVGLAGVLIVMRPGAGTFNWPALLIIGNVIFVAGRDLVTRRLGVAVPTLLVTVMSIGAVGLSGLLLIPFESAWRVPTMSETLLILVAAISSVGGFYWVTEALRRGEVSVVISFRYALIPYGVVAGLVVFSEVPDATTLLGSAIVLAAGLYALHRERVARTA